MCEKTFVSIREAAQASGLAVSFIRSGVKSGTIPAIRSGSKYLIHYPGMLETLTQAAKGGVQ